MSTNVPRFWFLLSVLKMYQKMSPLHSPCQFIYVLPLFQLYTPEPPFWWTLSSFFFFPWAASACHVETQLHPRHASERIIGLIDCYWANYEEILLSAECMHWKCRPETLLPLNSCASALRRFASAKASRVWKSHGPGVSDSFETMLVTAIEAFWIRIWRGAWVRMWLSLRGGEDSSPSYPPYAAKCVICHWDFVSMKGQG